MAQSLPKTAAPSGPALGDLIPQIAFLKSAEKSADLPAVGAPEIAVAGRSNAGKSSALNMICNRRRLAFSSKTPGRTQLINYFSLIVKDAEVGRLVDLPGYGYAAVDQGTQKRWQAELSRFLEHRLSLVGLLLVMDARHPFGPLDIQMLEWFGRRRQPIHILLTKADKLSRSERTSLVAKADATIAQCAPQWGGEVSFSLFSVPEKVGRDDVLDRIGQWWGLVQNDEAKKNPARESPGGKA